MMRVWKKAQIAPDTPILEAMRIIDASSLQIALVTEEQDRLVGVVTDGDIRRGLLKGISLEEPVNLIMNRHFTSVTVGKPHSNILNLMTQKDLRHIPVLDEQGRIVDLKILEDLIKRSSQDNWVVLMAGGLGARLRPLTNDCPKPMLRIGNKPLLETILENFIDFGYQRFFMAVNYKAEMIEDHFGDGSDWGVTIEYLREKKPLGTAGALGLLPARPSLPFLVMNGDVLTKINLQHLLDFHQTYQAKATMCVREYRFQVPYGVIQTDQHRLKIIDEKPVQKFFVNAGIYVLEPLILDFVPDNDYLDMPALFEGLITKGLETIVFPIREYWMDIGRLDDIERANGEYYEIFG
jgi:dTDP-glucose pyrophosphorylase/predicted transcriptional regulator